VIVSEPGPTRFPSRLLAVVAAALMIGASLAVRALVIDDDEGDGGGSGDRGGTFRIACAAELRSACEAAASRDVEVVVEPAGETEAALTSAAGADEAEFDAWLAYAPSVGIVADARERAGLDPILGDPGEPLARSPLVLVARADRAGALRGACGGDVTWACLGEVAGRPWPVAGGQETWGRVRPAHGHPRVTGNGLLALGHAVGTYLATGGIGPDDVSRLDWETSDAFPGWFQRLERSMPADAFDGGDPFTRFLQTRLRAYDFVATTEAAATTELARAAPDVRDAATVLYAAPVATADVVLARVGEADPGDLAGDLRDALAAAGFRVAGDPPPGAGGAPAMPDTDGLPSSGALIALRDYWEDVVR
jgi:hypothetical protein